MRIAAFLFCLCCTVSLFAQPKAGLVAHYTFENTNADAAGNTANAFTPPDKRSYVCGVEGKALEFRTGNENAIISGPANDEFNTEDFSLSFYFQATNQNGIQYLLHKLTSNCKDGNFFYIRYRPFSRTLNVFLGEGAKTVNLIGEVPAGKCWHHVAVIRETNKVKLYINGVKIQELNTQGRINLSNDGMLTLGNPRCVDLVPNQAPFIGLMDEVRLYNRSLNDNEIKSLYTVEPDNIVTRDTSIFVGGAVKIKIGPTCNYIFNWSPTLDVISPFVKEPVIQPLSPGIHFYTVDMSDDSGACTATDSIRITVIDPNTLDCGQVLLPKAFTPNGDGLNETFGISNPFVIQELLAFEIFDRWGSRVFGSADPFSRWDGKFQGKEVNPGVMLYKIRYRCKGEEKLATGSLMILR